MNTHKVYLLWTRQWDGSGHNLLRVYDDIKAAEKDGEMIRSCQVPQDVRVDEVEYVGSLNDKPK